MSPLIIGVEFSELVFGALVPRLFFFGATRFSRFLRQKALRCSLSGHQLPSLYKVIDIVQTSAWKLL